MSSHPLAAYPTADTVNNISGLGEFITTADVGGPALAGKAFYDPASQQFTVTAGGFNMWFIRDDMHYVYKQLKGDFILRARVQFIGDGVELHRKIGWTVRRCLLPFMVMV